MVVAGLVVDLLFSALGLIPTGPRPPSAISMAHFTWNYTTWLDLAALAWAGFLAWKHFRSQKDMAHMHHEHMGHDDHHDMHSDHAPHGHEAHETDAPRHTL